ncbi:hypothetical protein [Kutzneria sp. NPDC051319]|uniref:hypothetical protein n=1 Tax=Kutzneria sp. NPDC051319 TaxID=3155047 RepID=UPI00343BB2D9
MTSPGARQAQQNYQQQVQNNSATFRRNAAHHASTRRRGPMGPIRALLGLVFSLIFVAIAVGIFLMILNAAQPELLDQAKTWLGRTF